jgi:hypothetical protein
LYALVCTVGVIVNKVAAFVKQIVESLYRVNIKTVAEEKLSRWVVGWLACQSEID